MRRGVNTTRGVVCLSSSATRPSLLLGSTVLRTSSSLRSTNFLVFSGVLVANRFSLLEDKFRQYSTEPTRSADVEALVTRLEASPKKLDPSLQETLQNVTSTIDPNIDVALLDRLTSALQAKPAAFKHARLEKILDAYIHLNEGGKAVVLADKIRGTKGFVPDYALFSSMAKVFAKNDRSVTALRVVRDLIIEGNPPISVADATEIAKHTRTDSDSLVLSQIWKHYTERNMFGDLDFYRELMRGALRAGRPGKALWYFGCVEKTTRTIKWDSSSYAALLQALGRVDRRDLVLKWLKRISNRGHPIDTVVLNGYLSGLAAVGDPELAMDKLTEMERGKGIAPVDFNSYQSFVEGCSFAGRIEKAWAGVRKMKEKGFTPTLETYNAIIKGCINVERLKDVDDALSRMTAEGLKPNLDTFNAVLVLCSMQKDVTKAEQVFKSLLQEGLAPNSATYAAIIDACFGYAKAVKEGDVHNPTATQEEANKALQVAERYFEDMVQRNVHPPAAVLYKLLELSISTKDTRKAFYYYNFSRSAGLRLTKQIVKAMQVATYQAMLAKRLV